MIKPTLLVLAAGMGSRYGSLKQMDGVGPGGEAIIDYSVYDAIRAGFGKVVFVIRRCFEADFREIFSPERFGGKIGVEYVFQELDSLPEGFAVPEGRVKPWGTNHALMMAAPVIREPFAMINADDFYGREGFAVMADFLRGLAGRHDQYCMVGYKLGNTLSDYGTVARGVCTEDARHNLTSIVERTDIQRLDGRIVCHDDAGAEITLPEDTIVSMNLFGFTPDYFEHSQEYFRRFLSENIDNPKAEFYIATIIKDLIATGHSTMQVLRSDATWFGVTYKEDREKVAASIRALVGAGEYPASLWK